MRRPFFHMLLELNLKAVSYLCSLSRDLSGFLGKALGLTPCTVIVCLDLDSTWPTVGVFILPSPLSGVYVLLYCVNGRGLWSDCCDAFQDSGAASPHRSQHHQHSGKDQEAPKGDFGCKCQNVDRCEASAKILKISPYACHKTKQYECCSVKQEG